MAAVGESASSAFPAWDRRTWMAAGVASVLVAVLLLVWTDAGGAPARRLLHAGAQLQFMHGMATFACATFMNIGARGARHAPGLFLLGTLFASGSFYAEASGVGGWSLQAARLAGCGVLAVGWLVLLWSARTIDRS